MSIRPLLAFALLASVFAFPTVHASPCGPDDLSAACVGYAVGKMGETCDSLDCGPSGLVRIVARETVAYAEATANGLVCKPVRCDA